MTTQSTAFTALGVSPAFSVQPGQSITYSSTGTFTGDFAFRVSRNQGASYQDIVRPAVDTNVTTATLKNETNAELRFRFEMQTDYRTDPENPIAVSGTCTAVITDVNDVVKELKDDNGRVYARVTDNGVEFLGTVSVADALSALGALTSFVGVEDTLTAHAGGTQAAALALSSTAFYHRISVCATAADSVILPAATVGRMHYVRNDGAASAQVFAALTETINAVASATGVPLGSGSGVFFVCTTAGKWTTAAGDELDGKWQVNASGAFLPNADNTYDIGNGASDPRDINLTRHVYSLDVITSGNVGAANTGSTAVEYGDGHTHQTVLTVATTLPAIAGGANLAVGKLLYTFPAGAIIVESAYMSLSITQTQGNINADTPDGGLGTVIGSGVVATLDGTGTFEDIITGQTFNDCTGTAEVKTAIPTAAVPLVIEAGAAHTVHFNVADGWAASGDAAAVLAGTVVLNWRFMA